MSKTVAVGSRARSPENYLGAAASILRAGGSALDAAEAGIRIIEDDPSDHGAGIGGMPNRDGTVELDAGIMDGTTRRFGGVAALQGHAAAISVARAVLEDVRRHVLIAGKGAQDLASRIGTPECDLLTNETRRAWEHHRRTGNNEEGRPAVTGTIDMLTLDLDGHLAAAVSTSGWEWKEPGRVGDSCLPGAGLFADNRAGAAACTGFGETSTMAGTARDAVRALARGASPSDAAAHALRSLVDVPYAAEVPDFEMTIVVLDPVGRHAGASTAPAKRYAVWESGEVVVYSRGHIPLG